MQFTVGLKLKGKTDHIAVDAEDALSAALKAKTEHPEAVITQEIVGATHVTLRTHARKALTEC
jgi:hypothetical protein